jgi:hypothetical protein
MRFAVAVLFLVAISPSFAQVLIPRGSTWKYYCGPIATNWNLTNFDDSLWPTGVAELGYGDGDEQTVINAPTNSPTTCYFRHSFIVTNSDIGSLSLGLLVDDGAIVYLNGTPVVRTYIRDGPVNYDTPAFVNVDRARTFLRNFAFHPQCCFGSLVAEANSPSRVI